MLRPCRRGCRRGVSVEWQINDNWRACEQLLNFAQLFVARIFPGYDHFGQAEHIFDIAEIRGFRQSALKYGIVYGEELLQDAALLGLQSRKRFVRFGMHANVALQIRGANRTRVKQTVGTEERDLRVSRPVF